MFKRAIANAVAVFLASCAGLTAAPDPATAPARDESPSAPVSKELREIRRTSPDPTRQVARIAAWIEARPPARESKVSPEIDRQRFERLQALTGPPALRQQAVQALRELRSATADPRQQILLVDEFLRLNAATLASLQPSPNRSPGEAKQAIGTRIHELVAARPDDVSVQLADALFDLRKQADPQEQIRLVAELLRLNRTLITEATIQKLHAPTEGKK